MSAKVYAALYQPKICRHLLPPPLRLQLIATLIQPLFDYCCSALTDISNEQNLRLQRALNTCVRFIFQIRRDEHITPFFEKLRWLKVRARRLFFVGCMAHSLVHNRIPKAIFCKLELRGVKSWGTRTSANTLIIPQCRTEFYKRSFMCTAVELWNGIPANIRLAPTLDTFKRELYEYLLRNNT